MHAAGGVQKSSGGSDNIDAMANDSAFSEADSTGGGPIQGPQVIPKKPETHPKPVPVSSETQVNNLPPEVIAA